VAWSLTSFRTTRPGSSEEHLAARFAHGDGYPGRISDSGDSELKASQVQAVKGAIRGNSRPLEGSLRGALENRVGCDLSRVRVHTDSAAEAGLFPAADKVRFEQNVAPNNRETLPAPGLRPSQVPAVDADAGHSPGEPLSPGARAQMEQLFRHDFSRVRVHADSAAGEAVDSVGAAGAFTIGDHVYFAPGRFDAASSAGTRLLAHELAHVVQQDCGADRTSAGNGGPGSATVTAAPRSERSGPLEADATAAADAVISGASPVVAHSSPVLVARNGGDDGGVTNSAVEQVDAALDRPQEHGVGDYADAFRILSGLSDDALRSTLAALTRQGRLELITTNMSYAGEARDRIAAAIRQVQAEASPAPQTSAPSVPVRPPGDLSTAGAIAFEPGVVSAQGVLNDPAWVESDIVGDQLSDSAPWTYTLTYKDGAKLVIPLEQVFNERLPTATLTLFRRHKASRRIVPCVLSRDDKRLSSLSGPVGDFSGIADLAVPRFDAATAPRIVSMVNAAQMLWFAKGMLEVLKVQSMNPLMGGGMGGMPRAGAGAAARAAGAAAGREGLTFVEIGAGDLKAAIELARKGGVKVIAVDPAAADAAAVRTLETLGGRFVKGVASDVAPGTADHVFQYFPYRIGGTGSHVGGGTWRLVEDTIRLLKPNGAAHFVTEDVATAEFLANEAAKRGLRAVITKTAAGAAAPSASGAGVPGFSKALEVLQVNIYK
jgi:hypothetical protein